MGFSTKGYTIQYFIDLFANTSNKQLVTNGVYETISPRDGAASVRADVLDHWLGGNTYNVVWGKNGFETLGKTPRTRILKALHNRKANGYVY